MTSIKVKFRPSVSPEQAGAIYYQIIHRRSIRQITSDCKVYADEWDDRRSMVAPGHNASRRCEILAMRGQIQRDIERLKAIIHRLEAELDDCTADDIAAEYRRDAAENTLFNLMSRTITRLRKTGRERTSETYTATLHSFSNFRQGRDIMLDHITPELMEDYEAWHRRRGVVPNTISFYMRILRALYNRAVEQGVVRDRSPFRHVYTGIDRTVKRALPLSAIRKIKTLDLSADPRLDHARDMFMMSFYLRGMSFIDMAYLRKTDILCRRVSYRRRKTGQRLTIGWTREMQEIIDKYPANPTQYLLPIICKPCANERAAYLNAGYSINRSLKQIARIAGITLPLTLYVARHSWASAAKTKGIPLGVISEGMGHNSEATTQIYLASLDTSVVDRANSKILSAL